MTTRPTAGPSGCSTRTSRSATGPRTQDEMMLGFVSYAELEPGQELPAQQQ